MNQEVLQLGTSSPAVGQVHVVAVAGTPELAGTRAGCALLQCEHEDREALPVPLEDLAADLRIVVAGFQECAALVSIMDGRREHRPALDQRLVIEGRQVRTTALAGVMWEANDGLRARHAAPAMFSW